MRALIVQFEDRLLRLPLPQAEVSVGSAPSNVVVLPFPGVSRIHARLTPTPAGALLTDSGSKNRLIVNGQRADRVELTPGLVVQIGKASLMLDDVSSGDLTVPWELHPDEHPSARHAGTATAGVHTDAPSRQQGAALALIRKVEALSGRALARARGVVLDEARTLFRAEAVIAFEQIADGELALVASAGAPHAELLDGVSAAVATRRGALRATLPMPGGTLLIAGERKRTAARGTAALLPHATGWELDLLDYLHLKLTGLERNEPAADAPRGDLVLPKGMIPGTSAAMTSLLSSIAATVQSNLDVLLLGETGTGKELVARMIHASGPSAGGAFVAINCAAIPSELLEAELFGVHGRVATGVDPRQGLFVQAHDGAIFLDEIGELPDVLQAKLLRVLQEREVLPIGASTPRRITVRVIAASNRNLLERMRDGRFRADLYYRLRGLQFHLPPLRERKDDIPALVLGFVERASADYRKRIRGVSRSAMELLMAHDWPGNVRELQNEVARAVLLAFEGGILQSDHFAPVRFAIQHRAGALSPAEAPAEALRAPLASAPPQNAPLHERVDAVEREAILEALHHAGGNKSLAAKRLGITRNGLAMKMARLGLKV